MSIFLKDKQLKNAANNSNLPDSAVVNARIVVPPSEFIAASPNEERVLGTPEKPMSRLAQALGITDLEKSNVSTFFIHDGSILEEEEEFWDLLNEKAHALLKELLIAKELSGNEESPSGAAIVSSDMHLNTYVTRDHMTVYGCIFPPISGGRALSFEELKAEIINAGIMYGVNYDLLQELIKNNTILKIFTLAEGKPARDGEDGKVIELFLREKKISFEADEHDLVDYKNLNWLQPIHSGENICQIIQPVPPEDGTNVMGIVLKGRVGKALARLPIGKNTAVNENHTAVIATCDGQLKFFGNCFNVEQMIKIDGDVDSSTGNLDVIGSITVGGSVTEGFTVKASGDIVIRGSVGGAELIAGSNIQIFQGMNGNFKGKLTAGQNVSSKYLENCFVVACGTVKAESIVNSNVVSSDKVLLNTGKGMILGSSVISFKGIEAKIIGIEQRIPTNITIGTDPKLYDELQKLRIEVKELSRKSEQNEKNINYLLEQENLDSKYQLLLGQLKFDQTIFNMNLSKKMQRITGIEYELKSGETCQIVVSQLYPPVFVTIGNTKCIIENEQKMCRIFKDSGEIVIGSK